MSVTRHSLAKMLMAVPVLCLNGRAAHVLPCVPYNAVLSAFCISNLSFFECYNLFSLLSFSAATIPVVTTTALPLVCAVGSWCSDCNCTCDCNGQACDQLTGDCVCSRCFSGAGCNTSKAYTMLFVKAVVNLAILDVQKFQSHNHKHELLRYQSTKSIFHQQHVLLL